MKPILFDKDETNFTTNGLGRLDCISCEVVEERNGMYELEAEIPITGAHAKEIEMHSIIGVIPHEGSNIQAFYVYKIGKPISGRFRVYGRHISYRLTDIPCMPFSIAASPQAAAQTLAGLKSNAIEACPFNFYTDITTPASYTQKTPTSIRQRLGGVEGSVIDMFGGEFEWDNWNVRLLKARGRLANVTGISLRYGKNITDIDQEEEIASTVTGVVPFWIDTDGNNLVTLPEHAVYAPTAGNYPYHLTQVLDLSSEFQDKPTVAQLRNTATLYVNQYGFGVPKVSIKVSFVDLWKSEEYKDIAPLEQVKLCDEITVDFEKLGVKAIAKVVKTTYDVLKERYTQIEVGSIRSTLAQAITDRDKDIDSVYLDVMSRVTQAAQNATAWLTSANGYVVAVKNTDGSWKEILFMDSNDPATARNCLRINNNGLGFWSHDRYPEGSALDGPYDNAWTIDGNLIADFITTGDLKSQNYVAPTGATSPYAVSGMDLALNNGNITSEYFVLTQLGAFLKGTIEAIGGKIGAATITQNALTIIGDFEIISGTGTFKFRPVDYGITESFRLAFQIASGNTTITIKKHTSSAETTEQTISISDTEQHVSNYLSALDATDEEQYYNITVSGSSTSISLYQTILAYMGQGGFKGVLQGIFKGYIESDTGKIAGLRYTGGGYFYGTDAQLINTYGYGGHESRLKIASGSFGSTDIKPNITRTYTEDGDTKNNSVLWDDANVAYRNEIQYHRNIGVGTGTPADPSGDLYPADGTVFFKYDGNEITNLYAAVGGQFLEYLSSNVTYGTDEPTGGNDGDAYIQLSSDLKISYVSADLYWTHERFIYNNSKITGMIISGHGSNITDIIAYKITGLVPNSECTINLTAQFIGTLAWYNQGFCNGVFAGDNVQNIPYESQVGDLPYVPFVKDNASHNYTLSFTPTGSVAYFWVKLSDIHDNYTISLEITNLTFQAATGSTGIAALWVNQNGTWQSGYFGGSGGDVFVGATASQAGAKGLVPAPSAGDQNKYLRGDGTWHTVSGGGGSYSKTLLYGNLTWPASTVEDITLSDSWSNYDALMFITGFNVANALPIEIFTIDTDILNMLTYTTNANGLVYAHNQNSDAGQWVRVCKGQSGNNTLHMFYSGGAGLYQVYGINY